MWKLLFLFSTIPVIAALAARWWFGLRVLADYGGRPCKCDPVRWKSLVGEGGGDIPREEDPAYEFGRRFRLWAMEEWKQVDPKGVASRTSSKRFGLAVPPLSGVVAIMAVVVAKIPPFGAISCFLAATSLAAVLGVMSLAPELAAINRSARRLREVRAFSRSDDEEAVIRCAIAHAWKETLPPALAILQK